MSCETETECWRAAAVAETLRKRNIREYLGYLSGLSLYNREEGSMYLQLYRKAASS